MAACGERRRDPAGGRLLVQPARAWRAALACCRLARARSFSCGQALPLSAGPLPRPVGLPRLGRPAGAACCRGWRHAAPGGQAALGRVLGASSSTSWTAPS
eukprot:10593984-Lingulodinium_polyedra.AAC.1